MNPGPLENDLWKQLCVGNGQSAREKLFNLHFPFARSIALKLFRDRKGADIELADLCQLACAGLLQAIDRYDATRESPFRAFAAPRISGSILNGIPKLSERREQMAFRSRVRAERVKSLTGDAAGSDTTDSLDRLIEVTVGLALGFMLDDTALVSGDHSARQPTAYDDLAWKQLVAAVIDSIDVLPEREAAVIRQHYLEGLSFEQVGAVLGVGKSRVSQLNRSALTRLRKHLAHRFEVRSLEEMIA